MRFGFGKNVASEAQDQFIQRNEENSQTVQWDRGSGICWRKDPESCLRRQALPLY